MLEATKGAATGGVGAFVGPGEGLFVGGGGVGDGAEHDEVDEGVGCCKRGVKNRGPHGGGKKDDSYRGGRGYKLGEGRTPVWGR